MSTASMWWRDVQSLFSGDTNKPKKAPAQAPAATPPAPPPPPDALDALLKKRRLELSLLPPGVRSTFLTQGYGNAPKGTMLGGPY